MKKSVMLLALLCLLFVFQSVFAEIVDPAGIDGLIYDGTDQELVTAGKNTNDSRKFFYYDPGSGSWREQTAKVIDGNLINSGVPVGHFPGTYTVQWALAESADKIESKHSITVKILEFNPPQPMMGLVEDGGISYLINSNTGKIPAGSKDKYYYRVNGGSWSTDLPEASAAGTYTVEYYLANPDNPPKTSDSGTKFTVTVAKKGSSPAPVTPEPVTPEDSRDPQPISRVYDGLERPLIKAGAAVEGSTWWYKLISFSNPADSAPKSADASAVIHGVPSETWTQQIPLGTAPGTYVVRCLLLNNTVTNPDDLKLTDITVSKDVTVVIGATEGDIPAPQPGPRPRPDVDPGIPFYYNGDGSDLFSTANTLPATGFPTRIHVPLSVKPENVNYEQLAMRIQIPTINVDTELAGVPAVNGSWMVEWLGDRAGLLSGSAIPGEGYSMIAAHNHLNTEEYGPFALLFSLEENDRIFVNTAEDGLQIYSVYANELLEPDDLQKMAAIAGSEEDALILVTCENEMIEGGYMNRRAVFAKPLF